MYPTAYSLTRNPEEKRHSEDINVNGRPVLIKRILEKYQKAVRV
jgi:hypothetical protein